MAKKYLIIAMLFFGAMQIVVSCGGPKAANKENFAKAITPYLAKQQGVYWDDVISFPNSLGNMAQPEAKKALLKAGVIASVGFRTTAFGEKYELYDLTEKGRQSFLKDYGFFVGKPKLVEIINFTEPASNPLAGYVLSTVSYTYKLDDIPSWITSPDGAEFRAVLANSYCRERGFDNVVTGSTTCVLTANGWVHESMIN